MKLQSRSQLALFRLNLIIDIFGRNSSAPILDTYVGVDVHTIKTTL